MTLTTGRTRFLRKGQPKTKKVTVNGDAATRVSALLETSIQLSDYKYKLLSVLPAGYTVRSMAVQTISRDGGLMISALRGLKEKAPLIPINGVSKHWIDRFFRKKRAMLFEALEKDYSPLCRRRERWLGKKCDGYCEVKEECLLIGGWENEHVDNDDISEDEF